MIARAFPSADLEAFEVRATANGWLVMLGLRTTCAAMPGGEMFVFRTREELAHWISLNLPEHTTPAHS